MDARQQHKRLVFYAVYCRKLQVDDVLRNVNRYAAKRIDNARETGKIHDRIVGYFNIEHSLERGARQFGPAIRIRGIDALRLRELAKADAQVPRHGRQQHALVI